MSYDESLPIPIGIYRGDTIEAVVSSARKYAWWLAHQDYFEFEYPDEWRELRRRLGLSTCYPTA